MLDRFERFLDRMTKLNKQYTKAYLWIFLPYWIAFAGLRVFGILNFSPTTRLAVITISVFSVFVLLYARRKADKLSQAVTYVAGIMVLVSVSAVLLDLGLTSTDADTPAHSVLLNLSTEIIGITVTAFLFARIVQTTQTPEPQKIIFSDDQLDKLGTIIASKLVTHQQSIEATTPNNEVSLPIENPNSEYKIDVPRG